MKIRNARGPSIAMAAHHFNNRTKYHKRYGVNFVKILVFPIGFDVENE